MNEKALRIFTTAQAHLVRLRDERGQASTEYAGILFVIVAIIAALVGLSYTDVGEAIKSKIIEAVGQVGS
jgi:Flp pilus assembly pilin Flp